MAKPSDNPRTKLQWPDPSRGEGWAAVNTQPAAQFDQPSDRLQAWCLAYCQFGLTQPGHYRVLFESWSAERVEVPLTELPGYRLRAGLLGLVRDCASPTENAEQLSTLVWAALHGLVSLRINKPSFNWPPIKTLLDALLATMGLAPSR